MKELFINKEDCCGCSACFNICHKNAITMKQDVKGYLYPSINQDLCVNCGLCERVCPLKKENINNNFEKIIYGVKNNNQLERSKSSSGAVFIEAAKAILAKNGSVYGVELTSDFQVQHGRYTNLEDVRKFQGSKYVQSDKNEVFKLVQTDLKKGMDVLFTGTPCEIAGLKKYLLKDYSNLYTLDIICHGVPSMKLLMSCIKEKEKQNNSSVKELKFREKKYGWRNQEIYMKLDNGTVYHAPIWVDKFYRLFTNNYILRDSCYKCKFANMERQGDITVGDFWNIKNVNENFEDNLGVSSVIINTEKGMNLFENIKTKFELIECTSEDISQPNLHNPSSKPDNYDKFQKDCETRGFEYCLEKYGTMSIGEKIRRKLSPLKQRLLNKK